VYTYAVTTSSPLYLKASVPINSEYLLNPRAYPTSTASITTTTNATPYVSAGSNQSITLPTSSVTLDGSASYDPDGTISSYTWTQVSGPSTATIGTPNASTTVVSSLIQGIYTFKLTVIDNKGAWASANVSVVVNPAPTTTTSTTLGPSTALSASVSGSSLTLTFYVVKNTNVYFTIKNSKGKTVYSNSQYDNLGPTTKAINISGWASGTYTVTVRQKLSFFSYKTETVKFTK
jgi:hypothetical protein